MFWLNVKQGKVSLKVKVHSQTVYSIKKTLKGRKLVLNKRSCLIDSAFLNIYLLFVI